jgi:hypothetical protein
MSCPSGPSSAVHMSSQRDVDLTPAADWPPRFEGEVDQARMCWLTHPALDAAELRLAPDLAALVATRRFPG